MELNLLFNIDVVRMQVNLKERRIQIVVGIMTFSANQAAKKYPIG